MRTFLYIIPSVLIVTSSLQAQDALGTGNALDNNLSTSGRENYRRNLPRGTSNNEIRTNSVLAGRSFNDGVGLGSEAHMQLISDAADAGADLLADTLENSPWYWNNWNNQSVQFLSQGDTSYFNPRFIDHWAQSPMKMRIGQSMQSFSHAWSANDDTSDQSAKLNYPSSWSTRQIGQHVLSLATGSTYDPSQEQWSSIPVGNLRTAEGSGYITASSLRGIALDTTNYATVLGLTAWDAARAQQDSDNGIGPKNLVNRWVKDTGLGQGRMHENQQVASSHDFILGAVHQRAVEQKEVVPLIAEQPVGWLDQQYNLLQGQLAGTIRFDEEDEFDGIEDSTAELKTQEEDGRIEIAFILKHGQRIEQLTSKDKTRFNELMVLAQERFDSEEYFWAERRYDRALRFVPGHPLATAGLGHSRIGAGLYLSASLILQSLLSLQPEMIDVDYAENLLPPRLELVKAAVLITKRLDEERDGGTYAFLLAYLGHQIGDREMIERGLQVFEEREGSNDPFVQLLKRIWL